MTARPLGFLALMLSGFASIGITLRVHALSVRLGDAVLAANAPELLGSQDRDLAQTMQDQSGAVAGLPTCSCPCDADVNNAGGVSFPDIQYVLDCAALDLNCDPTGEEPDCSNCVSSCDVNCDGSVDCADVQATISRFQGFPPTTACASGACCLPNGACAFESASECSALGGTFSGSTSTCAASGNESFPVPGFNCCPQPVSSYTGAADCTSAIMAVISVPPGGSALTLTRGGNNTTASSNDCMNLASDAIWWEAFTIDAPAIVTLDFCCTGPEMTPTWQVLFDNCPCGTAIPASQSDVGGTCCDNNVSMTFWNLLPGTYYYPIESGPPSSRPAGGYIMHITVRAALEAACCYQQCVGGSNAGAFCQSESECPGGSCNSQCALLSFDDCADRLGYYQGPPNQSTTNDVCSTSCNTGACCPIPGVCVDDQDAGSGITPMTNVDCDALSGVYHGGRRCFGGTCTGGANHGSSCATEDHCPAGNCQGHLFDLQRPPPCPGACDIQENPVTEPFCDGSACGPTGESLKTGAGIKVFSGESHWSATDLTIPGRGFDFVLTRTYRSRTGRLTVQGHNWDTSYNIYLEECDGDLLFYDGSGRVDRFPPQPDNSWTRPEYFRLIEQNLDGSFEMTLADKSVWAFRALDGSVAQGRITSMTDRNNNQMTFEYDMLGRLWKVRDTLNVAGMVNRVITYAYNTEGMLSSVSDWTGRQVVYAYYQTGEGGGSPRDLKSARSPVVTGTTTGNNFPSGKTTTYTYSTDFADARRNHNLLSIMDAKGQSFLSNVYSPSSNPADLFFDRVVAQTYGGGQYEYVYKTGLSPGAFNGAVAKTIVNNRAGDVKELFYDARNRLVIMREYNGRAASFSSPTDLDLSINPPGPPLRGDDPVYFESQYDWNNDSLITQSTYPNENVIDYVYDSGNPNPRARGTRTSIVQTPGVLGGDQPQITESLAYGIDFYGCGTDFATGYTDGRSIVTGYGYDGRGNRTQVTTPIADAIENFEYSPNGQLIKHIHGDNGSGCRRVDLYKYYEPADGIQNGYLKEMIVDAVAPPDSCAGAHFSLTTQYEYDAVGNVIRTRDAKNQATDYEVNALNQTVSQVSRQVTGSVQAVRYLTQTFYDANNNVVRTSVQDVAETGVPTGNTWHTIHQYDVLDDSVATCRNEVPSAAIPGPPAAPTCDNPTTASFLRTTFEYDRNKNRSVINTPQAVAGGSGATVTTNEYDARDLIFKSTLAQGSGDQTTTQADYDGNGQTRKTHEGLENNPRVSTSTYDGYGRVKTATDAMGNVRTHFYDGNGNLDSEFVTGQLIDTPAPGGTLLYSASYDYDALNRRTVSDVGHFDPNNGGAPIGDGVSTSITAYTGTSQVKSFKDDNNKETLTAYDTANRVKQMTDAANNTVSYEYDSNGNLTQTVETEVSDLGSPQQTFTTVRAYDATDRLISTTDNAGNEENFGYDSRGNQVLREDPLGRETRYVYDGLSRLLKTVRDMNGNGADVAAEPGDGNPDIVTAQSWDRNSRLESQTDDNDNTTAYNYDALDRRTSTDFADCTSQSVTYDVHGNVDISTDANGTVVDHDYDALNRLVEKTVLVFGPGVEGTTAEHYNYNGLSQVVIATDDDSTVIRDYDSLSNVISDSQNGEDVSSTHDGVGSKTLLFYPGGRVIETTYDNLNRKRAVCELDPANCDQNSPALVAHFAYIGPSRIERKTLGNGTRTDYTYDLNTNAPKHITRARHTIENSVCLDHSNCPTGTTCECPVPPDTSPCNLPGVCVIDDRTFLWNEVGNKKERKDVRDGGPRLTHGYAYDRADRLEFTDVRDVNNGIVRQTDYDLDGVGNREQVTGSPDPGQYDMAATACAEPADFEMNQYTATSFDVREYDRNGNLIRISPPPPPFGPPTPGNGVCVGGSNPGSPCSQHSDCLGGGKCHLNNRFLSIVPSATATPSVIQVTAVSLPNLSGAMSDLSIYNGDVWYVGAPAIADEQPPAGGPSLKVAQLQCGAAELRDWSSEGLLHIHGAVVVPSATYEIRHCGFVGGPCSAPLTIQTAKSGDIAPPLGTLAVPAGQPNFIDISAEVSKFQAQPTAQSKARTKMTPNVLTPATHVNFLDISHVVGAFQGQKYPFPAAGCPAAALALIGAPTVAGDTPPTEIAYDYRNQMVRYLAPSGVETEYRYDALGRRIQKTVDTIGTSVTTRFLYDGWQEIEEQDGPGATLATYTFGNYIDEILTMQADSAGAPTDYFYHADDMYNVMAVSDSSGAAVERYEYQDYGLPEVQLPDGSPLMESGISNPILFNSRRLDLESGLYFYRSRYLESIVGRFSTRDTIGIWHDEDTVGNGFSYAATNPFTFGDPSGTVKYVFKQLQGWFGNYSDPWGSSFGKFTVEDTKATSYIHLIAKRGFSGGVCNTVQGKLDEVSGSEAGTMILLADELEKGTHEFRVKLTATVASSFSSGNATGMFHLSKDDKNPLFRVQASDKQGADPENKIPGVGESRTVTVTVKSNGKDPTLVAFFRPTLATSGKTGRATAEGTIEVLSHKVVELAPKAPQRPAEPLRGIIGCFPRGTLVHTTEGATAIELLKIGDCVLAGLADSSTQKSETVERFFSRVASELVQIHLPGEVIQCTGEHPFWKKGRGWTRAKDLSPGDGLLDREGREVAIIELQIRVLSSPIVVYNLQVAGSHSYYVGESGLLVHNKKP